MNGSFESVRRRSDAMRRIRVKVLDVIKATTEHPARLRVSREGKSDITIEVQDADHYEKGQALTFIRERVGPSGIELGTTATPPARRQSTGGADGTPAERRAAFTDTLARARTVFSTEPTTITGLATGGENDPTRLDGASAPQMSPEDRSRIEAALKRKRNGQEREEE